MAAGYSDTFIDLENRIQINGSDSLGPTPGVRCVASVPRAVPDAERLIKTLAEEAPNGSAGTMLAEQRPECLPIASRGRGPG